MDTPHLNFDANAYRDAVAIVSAYMFDDGDTCEELLQEAGRDVACAFTVMMWAAIHLIAKRGGDSSAVILEHLGTTAAHFASLDGGERR
ncbi:MAG TPA: hypothetical protein VK778_16410 [Solirubrobacteraceae bacterium]|nr:hypothetical protein [Solirubrobacteraceae bacterium]